MGKCHSKSADLGQLSQLNEEIRISQYGRTGVPPVKPLQVNTTSFASQTVDEEPGTPATAMLDAGTDDQDLTEVRGCAALP